MRDLRSLRRTVIAAAVGAALMSGCSEKQEASDTLPSPSAAETTEALPELGPPDLPMPDEAREKTVEGAEAFTEYYVELYNHAIRTLDTTWMRDLSSGCDTCDQLAQQVDGVAAAGQEYEGGQARIVASTPPFLTGNEAQLVFDVVQEPLSVTANGLPVPGQTMPEQSTTGGGGILRWSDERTTWLITQWNVP